MYQSQNHCWVNSHYPRWHPHKPQLKCASLDTYLSHRIRSHARLVDSPSSCLSPAFKPFSPSPPPDFYEYIIHVHARIHAHTHTLFNMHTNSPCLLYMYLSFPNLKQWADSSSQWEHHIQSVGRLTAQYRAFIFYNKGIKAYHNLHSAVQSLQNYIFYNKGKLSFSQT